MIRSAEELSQMLGRHKEASVQTIITRSLMWDNARLWLLLLGLLSAEWVLRRIKGLA
jgi:hypothetical protein